MYAWKPQESDKKETFKVIEWKIYKGGTKEKNYLNMKIIFIKLFDLKT